MLGLEAQPDTFVELDLERSAVLPAAMPHSKCGWTPFAGRKVRGAVSRVVLRGELVDPRPHILKP